MPPVNPVWNFPDDSDLPPSERSDDAVYDPYDDPTAAPELRQRRVGDFLRAYSIANRSSGTQPYPIPGTTPNAFGAPPSGHFFDAEGNAWPEPGQEASRPFNNRSITDPQIVKQAWGAFARNPNQVKENLISETLGRLETSNPNLDFDTMQQQAPEVATQVFQEAKTQGFGPYREWLTHSTPDTRETARDYLAAKTSFVDKFKQKPEQIKSGISNFLDRARYPSFIANALALRNPVVEAGGIVKEGDLINPQAVKFLKEFKPSDSGFGATTYDSPFGTKVNVAKSWDGDRYDLAFEGPFGYARSGDVKRELTNARDLIQHFEDVGNTAEANRLRDHYNITLEKLQEPLRSPALRYTLGAALEDIPVGSTIAAAPIGAEKGSRARIYERMTNKALATARQITPDFNQVPSEEEFREASQGGGMTRQQLRQRNSFGGQIRSERTSPNTWRNINNEERTFDPASLKDEMIRATYNLPSTADVSSLRSDPLGIFKKTDRIDFTRPVITTESLPYRIRGGISSAANVGAADFIPTPEAIRSFYAGKPMEGAMNMAGNIVGGIPASLAAGAAVTAAPALAPIAAGAGLGMTAVSAGNAANEVVRQQTGEGIVPKFRQFIGTAPRTGVSSPQRQGTRPLTSVISPMTPAQRQIHNIQQTQGEFARRAALARSRFNPARGEFGLSEMLFGR